MVETKAHGKAKQENKAQKTRGNEEKKQKGNNKRHGDGMQHVCTE